MSTNLRRYLIDEYEGRRATPYLGKIDSLFPIQLDDQDDNDNIDEFCNIFCIVNKNDSFSIELSGTFPITESIADLVDIYNGFVDKDRGRLMLKLKATQIEAIMDLADRIKKTAMMGKLVANPSWLSLSARTISSLYRFVRIIKEYNQMKLSKAVLVA
jgi:hypothetical protein